MKDTLLKFFTEQENRLLAEFSICLDVKQRIALYYWQIVLFYTNIFNV